jgi:protein-tyrosine phosphatase
MTAGRSGLIDLHCHILFALDDGPADLEASLELARTASGTGTRTIVATPHVRDDYPFDLALIPQRTAEVNRALRSEGIDLHVLSGGEVSLSRAPEMSDDELRSVALGGGPYLLVESPYTHATDLLERQLFDLQLRGFQVLLAHPERSPSFLSDASRLASLVQRGFACSVTAASLTGRFGRTVRRFSVELLRAGLVHDVASDAHDAVARTPDLAAGLRAVDQDVPGALEALDWFTVEAPAAILSGSPLGSPPQLRGGGGWRRAFRRPKRPPRRAD